MAVPGIQIWRSTKIPDLHHLLAMGRQNADPNRNSRIVPKDVLALVLHEVDSWEWLHNLQGLLQNENSWSWLGAVMSIFPSHSQRAHPTADTYTRCLCSMSFVPGWGTGKALS